MLNLILDEVRNADPEVEEVQVALPADPTPRAVGLARDLCKEVMGYEVGFTRLFDRLLRVGWAARD